MNKYKGLLLALLVSVVVFGCATNNTGSANAASGDVEGRHVEAAGGFSILVPKSWQTMEWPGLKYQVIIGPSAYDFTPNINFVDESYNGRLEAYVDACLEVLKQIFYFELIQRNEFVTAKNLKGEKVIIHSVQNERPYRQTFYFFSGRNGKQLLATCTVPVDAGTSYDGLFDNTLKSFEWTD
ncbi:MAG: hypothetical protein LBH97_05130 [Treponema sp.]|nr:hypothetical protein [Treponema sp.]